MRYRSCKQEGMISGDTYGVLNRLLLNEKIDPSPEGILRILGFVHLYTASGLHLLALEAFLQRIFGRTLESRKILTVLFWFFLILLWKLQGFRLGFARILVLFFLKALAKEKGLRFRVYYPLFFALCFDFAMGIDAGWKHYYLAILGGMIGIEAARKRETGAFLQHLYLSVGSWLMTAPLDLIEHHEVAWMTPIWSMITIPVISLVLYPASVFSYLFSGDVHPFLMSCWNRGLELLYKIVDVGLTFSVIEPRMVMIGFVFALITLILCRRKIHFAVLVTVFFSVIFHPSFKDRSIQVSQLDVGQGDSLLVKTATRSEMIDLGSSFRVKPDAMIHRLALHGVTHLDTVLFSHLDEDHAGGLRLLLPWVPVSAIEVNSAFERTSLVRKWIDQYSSAKWCESGCFRSGSVDWISARKKKKRQVQTAEGNDLMGVAMIPISNHELYLSLGDSNTVQESVFWKRHHSFIESFQNRILKISHHGSKNSSSIEFIKSVNPSLAVISVGRRNRYRHPHFTVIDELKREKIPVHRTDRDGNYSISGG